jgi:hypothetical protein
MWLCLGGLMPSAYPCMWAYKTKPVCLIYFIFFLHKRPTIPNFFKKKINTNNISSIAIVNTHLNDQSLITGEVVKKFTWDFFI